MQVRHRAKADRFAAGLGCMACGFLPSADLYFSRLQAHHVRPVRDGGTFRDGLALLCKACHRVADELADSEPTLDVSSLVDRIRADRKGKIGSFDLASRH